MNEKEILSDITVHMKYAKYKTDELRRETWDELCERNMQMHLKKFPQWEEEIKTAYELVVAKKILPSMRSMQFAGKSIETSPNRIYNCAYLPIEHIDSFSETMFLLLGGTGVGYSVQRHHVANLPEVQHPNPNRTRRYLISDSIEGWADAVKVLMKSYFGVTKSTPIFDYSDIRKKGTPLITSGGKAPGPAPLRECLVKVENILKEQETNTQLKPIQVHDIMCIIADAVLAGGIRRAALISLFSADDHEMISCKSGNWWETHPERGRANNSAVLIRSRASASFFKGLWERIKESGSGEPGIYFSNDKDWGTNPCCEIALRPYQFCNLVEINASNLQDTEDLFHRVGCATFIATLQATYTDFHYLREVWKRNTERDALLGVSMTGIASNPLDSNGDKILSDINLNSASEIVRKINRYWANNLGINHAARLTCVKPAGTTSLVLGTSSGIHAWHEKFYIRRLRVGKNEAIYPYLIKTMPNLMEDDYFRPHDTAILSVPQKAPENAIIRGESALAMLNRISMISRNWVKSGHIDGINTHNVSATVSLKENEWEEVGNWLWDNREAYNGLSVLPYDGGTYKQAPFETITEEEYNELVLSLSNINLSEVYEIEDNTDLKGELACAGGACEI